MKRMMLTTIAGAFAAGLAFATTGDAAAQSLTLRISGENPATGNDLVMAQKFADLLKEELGDDFAYEFFHTRRSATRRSTCR
jgi:TRAP-type transport system periplasmic protein